MRMIIFVLMLLGEIAVAQTIGRAPFCTGVPGGGGGVDFSEDFNTDPSSRVTTFHGAFTWTGSSHMVMQTGGGGGVLCHNTSTGSITQYSKAQNLSNAVGVTFGVMVRYTGTKSEGYYTVVHVNSTVYLVFNDENGWVRDMDSEALTFAQNDVMAVTISGTTTSASVRVWKNPTNNTPYDASNWDSASDPPDITLTPSGGEYADAGYYVGFGVSDGADGDYDNLYGGSIP